ncbi:MAG TPA: DUF4400 domain-containing protein [Terriglobia bacterium]|nr:DUF4400 domain-containing protein [Terriglobia bacterium]
MKLLSIGALFMILASAAALVSGGQSGRLVKQTWLGVSDILPENRASELGSVIPTYTKRLFQVLPLEIRKKFGEKLWNAIELMTLRLLLMRYIAPTFVTAVLIGYLEGFWSRSSQQGLVKVHSPMRFNLGLIGLGTSAALILLWVTTPVTVPLILLLFCVFALAVVSIRSLILNAPAQL